MENSNLKKLALLGIASGLLLSAQSGIAKEITRDAQGQGTLAGRNGCGGGCGGNIAEAGSCGGHGHGHGHDHGSHAGSGCGGKAAPSNGGGNGCGQRSGGSCGGASKPADVEAPAPEATEAAPAVDGEKQSSNQSKRRNISQAQQPVRQQYNR